MLINISLASVKPKLTEDEQRQIDDCNKDGKELPPEIKEKLALINNLSKRKSVND